jgi:hypothetical protein
MKAMKNVDIKAFIPSKDYEQSKTFYTELGFVGEYVTDDLTLFESDQCTFFLQRFYNKELAENLMLQLIVLDIDGAFGMATNSKHKTKSHLFSKNIGVKCFIYGVHQVNYGM